MVCNKVSNQLGARNSVVPHEIQTAKQKSSAIKLHYEWREPMRVYETILTLSKKMIGEQIAYAN